MKLLRIALFLLTLGGAATASAHRIVLFAFLEGETIRGEALFGDGNPVPGALVSARDAGGKPLGEATTAPDGSFSMPLKEKSDHHLVMELPDGHRAEYRLAASEISPAVQAGQAPTHPAPASPASEIAAIVAHEVGLLRKELLAHDQHARFQDMLGGLGYIVGLFGAAFFYLGRKGRSGRE